MQEAVFLSRNSANIPHKIRKLGILRRKIKTKDSQDKMIKLHLQATLAFSFKLILKLQLRRTTRRRGGRGYFQGNREISGISRKIKESRKFMDIKEYYVREILKYQGNQEKYLVNQEKYQEKKENYQGNQEKYQKIKKYLGN